jgi:hypothetical protein
MLAVPKFRCFKMYIFNLNYGLEVGVEQDGILVTLYTCIQEVLDSTLCKDTHYRD